MFVLDKDKKKLQKVDTATFSSQGFKERYDLQEWILSNPESLGEELLYIQKEFSGWDDTNERLDVLAIDKDGNLVVIENKRDDSGRDVTWQALKYASYCYGMHKDDIVNVYQQYLDNYHPGENSQRNILDFLGKTDWDEVAVNQDLRIIMVSGFFPKEVTSTVMWLLTRYNMKIECCLVSQFVFENQIFVSIAKIIPPKGTEEYMIKMAEKFQNYQNDQSEIKESSLLRREFWTQLLNSMNEKTMLFANISPSKDGWLTASSGLPGVGFNLDIGKKYARAHVYLSSSDGKKNKLIYERLSAKRAEIEKEIPNLEWEPMEGRKACRIKVEKRDISLDNKENWPAMIEFMVDNMVKLEKVFKPLIAKIKISKNTSWEDADTV